MADLSDERLRQVAAGLVATPGEWFEMAREVLRHRSPVPASKQRVIEVVREATLLVLEDQSATVTRGNAVLRYGTAERRQALEFCADVIATRAAEQLATPTTCDNVVAFSDGELSPEQADVFRKHLPSCEACRRSLTECVQLSAQLSELNGASR